MKKTSGCLTSVWTTVIAPIAVGIVMSLIAGHIVIQISGIQFSIGLTIAIALIFFIVAVISFCLGIPYLLFFLKSTWTKTEMPLVYRIATPLLKPVLWAINKLQEDILYK